MVLDELMDNTKCDGLVTCEKLYLVMLNLEVVKSVKNSFLPVMFVLNVSTQL